MVDLLQSLSHQVAHYFKKHKNRNNNKIEIEIHLGKPVKQTSIIKDKQDLSLS